MTVNHIDEGTIHAWIDGALGAERAREVEAHVAQCAQCSAAVAEARGLVAASSRILSALDDVPANVTPKRKAPVAPKAPRRMWRAASWVTGIAAVLLAAVVLRTSRDVREPINGAHGIAFSPVVDTAVKPDSQRTPTAAGQGTENSAQAQASSAPRMAAAKQPTLQKRVLAGSDQPVTANGGVASVAAAPAPPVANVGSAGAAGAAGAAEMRAREASSEDNRRFESQKAAADAVMERRRDRAAEAATVVPQPSPLLRAPEPPSTLMKRIDVADVSGCYSFVQVELPGIQTTAAVADRRARSSAPVAAQDLAGRRVTVIVRLDTARNAFGRIAREASSDSVIGSWRLVGDSIFVENAARPIALFRPSAKRACPER